MGERNNISGAKLFFCKAEDLGTSKEEWTEIKLVEQISFHKATSTAQHEVKDSWSVSTSFTATLENPELVHQIYRKIRRHQRRRFHYIQQVLPGETKAFFRKLRLSLKVKKLKNK